MTQSLYTQALADEIIRRLSDGEPLAEICRSPGMPKVRAVSDWKTAHKDFGDAFPLARDDGYDAIANRVRNTARGLDKGNGGDSSGDVQRDKLIIDTDLKLLSKWDPRRYGDRMLLGNDPENPFDHVSDNDLDARIKLLMGEK